MCLINTVVLVLSASIATAGSDDQSRVFAVSVSVVTGHASFHQSEAWFAPSRINGATSVAKRPDQVLWSASMQCLICAAGPAPNRRNTFLCRHCGFETVCMRVCVCVCVRVCVRVCASVRVHSCVCARFSCRHNKLFRVSRKSHAHARCVLPFKEWSRLSQFGFAMPPRYKTVFQTFSATPCFLFVFKAASMVMSPHATTTPKWLQRYAIAHMHPRSKTRTLVFLLWPLLGRTQSLFHKHTQTHTTT